jgi:PAS domain S-box-containing protein
VFGDNDVTRDSAPPRDQESTDTINAIADIVHGSLDFKTVAERAAIAMVDYTPFTAVSIFSLDETGSTLELVAYRGFSAELAETGRRIPVKDSLTGLAVVRREVVSSEDLAREARGIPEMRAALVREGFHKAICVPLIHQAIPLGAMNLVLHGDRDLSDLERSTLLSVSRTIGMALANAKHVQRLEHEMQRRRTAEERYSLATSAAKVGVWDWDLKTGELFLDPNIKALLGYSDDEIANDLESWSEHIHTDDRELVKASIDDHLGGRTAEFVCEHRMVHRDGSLRWIMARGHALRDDRGEVVRMVGTNTDITERKRLEEERRELENQMLHAEKLKSLGVLAGGIAHDFNNLLTSILGNAGLAASRSEPDSVVRPFIAQIETASRRAAELTRQLLAYSGRGVFVLKPVDVVALVREMTDLLHLSISKKAVLKYEFTEGLPTVEGDQGQLRQVIMNLITNASESLGNSPGSITLRTGVTQIDPRHPPEDLLWKNLAAGDYLFFEVTDSGCGMDDTVRAKIFDPFFTTKFSGRGLGLAAVQGIVRGHGGGIEIQTSPDNGTRIRVLLPLGAQGPRVQDGERPSTAPLRGAGTVLVIDDEEAVRTLVSGILIDAGFTVITAGDGQEGLELFSRRADDVRLVLLDLTMPRLGGDEVLAEIRRLHPAARVILSSGYNATDASHCVAGIRPDAFLEKPYTPDTLLDSIRKVLE